MEKLGLLAVFVQSVLASMPSCGDIFNDPRWRLLCAQALFNLVNNRVCGEGPSRTISTFNPYRRSLPGPRVTGEAVSPTVDEHVHTVSEQNETNIRWFLK
jgi:hypothetical protein